MGTDASSLPPSVTEAMELKKGSEAKNAMKHALGRLKLPASH